MIDSDEQRHYTAAENARAKHHDTTGAEKVGVSETSSYGGSGGFQATGMYDDDDDDDDEEENSFMNAYEENSTGWYDDANGETNGGDNGGGSGSKRPGDDIISRWYVEIC